MQFDVEGVGRPKPPACGGPQFVQTCAHSAGFVPRSDRRHLPNGSIPPGIGGPQLRPCEGPHVASLRKLRPEQTRVPLTAVTCTEPAPAGPKKDYES